MKNIIFQAMNDDFVDSMGLDQLNHVLQTVDTEAVNQVYYFTIHLGSVSSKSPLLFFAYKRGHGCFVSIYEQSSSAYVNFVAVNGQDYSTWVDVLAGEHHLKLPPALFLSPQDASRSVIHFCKHASRDPETHWIPYDELDWEVYE